MSLHLQKIQKIQTFKKFCISFFYHKNKVLLFKKQHINLRMIVWGLKSFLSFFPQSTCTSVHTCIHFLTHEKKKKEIWKISEAACPRQIV